jgi:hypothetical protein
VKYEQAEEGRMIRTPEDIQQDIHQIASEIQELRRIQRPTCGNDRLAVARRIYQLTARLDALYAEKRTACVPAPLTRLPDTATGEQGKAATGRMARLFTPQPAGD